MTVNIAATLTLAAGVVASNVTPYITAALTALFAGLNPGDIVRFNQIVRLILDQPGVVDVNLTSPSSNVVTLVDISHFQLAVLGSVIYS